MPTICYVCLLSFPGPKCPCAFDDNLFSLLKFCTDPQYKISAEQVATIANYYKGRNKHVPRKFNKDASPSPALQAMEKDLQLAVARAEKAEQELATLHKNAQAYARQAEERIGYLQSILHAFWICY